MNLFLERDPSDGASTQGTLFIDGTQFGYTLELPWRDNHPQESCIPAGRYRVVITWSEKFQRMMPEILGVCDRSGIRIHPLNKPSESEGCIGVGFTKGVDQIEDSRAAFDKLFGKLKYAWDRKEEIFITIQLPQDSGAQP